MHINTYNEFLLITVILMTKKIKILSLTNEEMLIYNCQSS